MISVFESEDTRRTGLPNHCPEQKANNTLRAKAYFSENRHTLIDLLDYSRVSDASDARDHVYSCLGLARRSYGIQPYYGPDISVEDIFTSVMRVLLLSNGGDIDILGRTSTAIVDHDDALPSWVPDWRKPVVTIQLDHYQSMFDSPAYSTGGHTSSSIDFDESGKVLITKGVRLDVLVSEAEPHYWHGQRVEGIQTFTWAVWSIDTYISPRPPEKGVEVWVLYGAMRPILLRKREAGYMSLRTVHVRGDDREDVMSGDWMNNTVDLEKDTKVLRII